MDGRFFKYKMQPFKISDSFVSFSNFNPFSYTFNSKANHVTVSLVMPTDKSWGFFLIRLN